MKYKVTLNNKIYEVEVEKGEATLLSEFEASQAVVSAPSAPVATPVAAPVVAATPVATPTAVASSTTTNATVKAVKSPLPGTIVNVKATVGQTVTKGTVIVVIEAMKMENEIVANCDGKISAIFVSKGSQVNTGAPLFEIN